MKEALSTHGTEERHEVKDEELLLLWEKSNFKNEPCLT